MSRYGHPTLRALQMPWQLASLMFLCALLAFYRIGTGLIGDLPYLWLIPATFTWLALGKYGSMLLSEAAEGSFRAPVPAIEDLGPFGAPGPTLPLVLGVGVLELAGRAGAHAVLATAVLLVLVLPASAVVLALTRSVRDALDPRVLGWLIRGLGWRYPLLLGAWAAIVLLAAVLLRTPAVPALARDALLFAAVLSGYAATGASIHARRTHLDFEPRHSPERDARRAAAAQEASRQRMLDEAWERVRTRRYGEAAATVSQYLSGVDASARAGEVLAIRARVRQWDDARAEAALAQELADQGLAL